MKKLIIALPGNETLAENLVKLTGAEKVFVTHGFQAAFSRYLNENGIEAAEVKTEYGGEEEDTPPTSPPEGEAFKEPDESTIKSDTESKENKDEIQS